MTKPTTSPPATAGYYPRSMLLTLRAGFAVAQCVRPAAIRAANHLFYVPRARKDRAIAIPGVEQTIVDVRDKKVACYTVGSGRPLLLIHGWESSVARTSPLIEALVAAGFRVTAFDMPAHGQSTGRSTDITEITEVSLALARQFGPFVAGIGHSYGGLCLANLVRLGLGFEKVILFSTPASYAAMIDRFCDMIGLWSSVRRAFAESIHRRYAPQRYDSDFDATRNLHDAGIGALIVHDVDDAVVPFSDAVVLGKANPNVSVLEARGLGHNKLMRDPETIKRCVEFLAVEPAA